MSDTTIRSHDDSGAASGVASAAATAAITATERARRMTWPTAAVVLLAGGALTAYGAHDLREIVVVLAVLALVVAGVYGWLIPRRLRSGRVANPALALSVLGLLLIMPAFWSALPLALGAAGVLLGQAGRSAPAGGGRSIAAVVIGALAVVAYFGTYVAEAFGV